MKQRKNFFISITFLLFFIMLFSCSTDEPLIPYDEEKNYTGFSNIPKNYTAKDAADDGCLVIDTYTAVNEHGASVTDKYETAGFENWETFLEKSKSGDNAFLRVAHFIDGVGYYQDLYYSSGKYTIFHFNEYGVSKGRTFTHLRRLDGFENQKENCYYVLTDSTVLTYEDIRWSFLSSDLSSVTKIPFEWLTFMIYFK